MTKKEMFVKAHKMAKEIKAEYPEVNYKFQFSLCLAYLQEEGENEMLKKVLESLKNLQEVKFNKAYGEQVIAEAIEMFNAGWDALEDGTVVLTKGNLVAVKKGNSIVKYEMKDFRVTLGKLSGNISKEVGTIEVPEDKKEAYLAQAIITKYYTVKRV